MSESKINLCQCLPTSCVKDDTQDVVTLNRESQTVTGSVESLLGHRILSPSKKIVHTIHTRPNFDCFNNS